MIDHIQLPADFSLHVAQDADEQFLADLFYSTRKDLQFLPLPAEQLGLLLQQQYFMQTKSYALQYPDAYRLVIQLNAQAIGKIMLHVSETHIHLVDFIVAESQRSKGYGTLFLTALQNYAHVQKLSLQLSVDHQNFAAQKLYARCGFLAHSSSPTHLLMQWRPS